MMQLLVPAKPASDDDDDDGSDRRHSIWQWLRAYDSSGLRYPELQSIFFAFNQQIQ